jgi:urea transporter
VAAFLLAATAVAPRLVVAGLLAVALATLSAHLLKLSPDLIADGLFGYNALLVGVGGAALLVPGGKAFALLAAAVLLSVFATAALHSFLGVHFGLPALTLPFLLVFYSVLAAAPALGVGLSPIFASVTDPSAVLSLPGSLDGFLRTLGALFFVPRPEAGALVAVGLIIYSRIGFMYALLGYGLGWLVLSQTALVDPVMAVTVGFNSALVALALGAVWFVPSLSSALFAAGGVLVGALLALALRPLLGWLGLPVLILPFNLTVILLLYAMRQRVRDGRPKAVDFLLGTPEENLSYFQTRLARFGARYAVRFRAPFRGRWVCTQGVQGRFTHKGPWRHALDFEVVGPDGGFHKGRGEALTDFHCYRLPVLAPADGTVAKVVDGVADSPVDRPNVAQNWGNLVIIYHGPWLYSMVCHLSPQTLKVREGQVVRTGDLLGLCGSSGRSPRPHLHFQLQATARVGAPTLPVELHDVVEERDEGRRRLRSTYVPDEGDRLVNLDPDDDLVELFNFPVGEVFELSHGATGATDDEGRAVGARAAVTERIEPDIDLHGRFVLRSLQRGTRLYYEPARDLFTVFDTVGSKRSLLRWLQLALARVPFELDDNLEWSDFVPRRMLLPSGLRPLFDLVSPLLANTGLEMRYSARWHKERLIVEGRSVKSDGEAAPVLETRATLRSGRGLAEIEVQLGGRRTRRVRVRARWPARESDDQVDERLPSDRQRDDRLG